MGSETPGATWASGVEWQWPPGINTTLAMWKLLSPSTSPEHSLFLSVDMATVTNLASSSVAGGTVLCVREQCCHPRPFLLALPTLSSMASLGPAACLSGGGQLKTGATGGEESPVTGEDGSRGSRCPETGAH